MFLHTRTQTRAHTCTYIIIQRRRRRRRQFYRPKNKCTKIGKNKDDMTEWHNKADASVCKTQYGRSSCRRLLQPFKPPTLSLFFLLLAACGQSLPHTQTRHCKSLIVEIFPISPTLAHLRPLFFISMPSIPRLLPANLTPCFSAIRSHAVYKVGCWISHIVFAPSPRMQFDQSRKNFEPSPVRIITST